MYNLGLLYEQEEEQEKAIEALEKAIALKPNHLKVYLELAELYQETEQIEKAKQSLEFILQNIDPDSKQAKKMLEEL